MARVLAKLVFISISLQVYTVYGWGWSTGLGLKNPMDAIKGLKKGGSAEGEDSEQVPQKVLDDLFKGVLQKSSDEGPEKTLIKDWESYMQDF